MGKEKQEITWREETNPEEILVLGNWGLSLKVVKRSERNLVRSNLVLSFKVMKQTMDSNDIRSSMGSCRWSDGLTKGDELLKGLVERERERDKLGFEVALVSALRSFT